MSSPAAVRRETEAVWECMQRECQRLLALLLHAASGGSPTKAPDPQLLPGTPQYDSHLPTMCWTWASHHMASPALYQASNSVQRIMLASSWSNADDHCTFGQVHSPEQQSGD